MVILSVQLVVLLQCLPSLTDRSSFNSYHSPRLKLLTQVEVLLELPVEFLSLF